MSFGQTVLLGAVAGATILLGLPLGRLTSPAPRLRVILGAGATGVLLFLFWDVLRAAWDPIDVALGATRTGEGGWGPVVGYLLLFAAGIGAGLLSLVAYDAAMARRAASVRPSLGPGAMSVHERPGGRSIAGWSASRQLALLIAVGIGLHNFAEGLAIGQSAASGEIGLAVVLVVGFALHNATEGFGIVAPLASDRDAAGATVRPSWRFLLALGVIGGGPTFVGTVVGHGFTSAPLAILFLTLAAGSILYVVLQLVVVGARSGRRDLLAYGILAGLLAGFLTDAVVTLGGA